MDFRLPDWLRPGLVLLLLTCLLTFSGLNRLDLRESTEPREAGIAADMLQQGQFLVPTLNGRPFLEKPPLSYWLQGAAIRLFGYEAFAPRVPSALAGIATVLLFVFFFRKSPEKDWLTLLSGCLLITMASFVEYARTAGQDAMLAFGVSLALLSFYFTREDRSPGLWLLYSAGIAIATLTKGVVGLAIPGVVVLVYLLAESICFDRRLVLANWLYPAAFALLGLLPILAWLWSLFAAQGFDAIREVVWTNSVGRFEGEYSQGAHAEPFYFYLKRLPETFQPWSLLLYVAIWQSIRLLGKNRRMLFLFCWMVAPYVLLSISAGKRPSYLLMLYPAAAALLAHFVVQTFAAGVSASGLRKARWLAGIQATIVSAIPLYVIFRLLKVDAPLVAGLCAVVALPLLFVIWRSAVRLRIFPFAAACVGVLGTVYIVYFSVVVPHDDQGKSVRRVVERLAEFAASGRPIALYQPTERVEGAVSFYLQREVPVLVGEKALRQALAAAPDTVVLIEEAAPVDFARVRDEAQIDYGKMRYHYVSGS